MTDTIIVSQLATVRRKQKAALLTLLVPAVFLTLFIVTDPASAQSGETPAQHTVEQGQTLFSISRMYDVTVAELREWNNLQSDDLRTGMNLRIAPRGQDAVTHTVEQGETLFAISRRYDVSIAELQQWNNLDSNVLSTGQELLIYAEEERRPEASLPEEGTEGPQQAEPDEPRESIVSPSTPVRDNTYYTVRSGDHLNSIASEHGMTTRELRELNNLEDDMIRVGQQLLVRRIRSTPVVDEGADESSPQGRFIRHRVESNENLSAILNRFQMNSDELTALNPGTDIGSLRSGQQITVLLPPSRTANNPYRERGGLEELGQIEVSVYRDEESATPTTSGELYNPDHLTAGHSNMALGSVIYVENPDSERSIMVKVNDRIRNDGIKLSRKAFEMLGFRNGESGSVRIYQQD